MKCVVVGDIFISEKIMEEACKEKYDIVKSFFFGTNDRKEMREIVKKLEAKEEVAIPLGLKEELKDADAVMVHLCPLPTEVLLEAKKLKIIYCNRGGRENIGETNIEVLTNPLHNANAVAEFTVGLIINEVRNISRSNEALKKGIWRENYPNSNDIKELSSMTIGIVGYGNVGKLVHEKLRAFGCRFIICDIDSNNLDEVLRESDVVTIHIRLKEKEAIITRKELLKMKPTAYLINTARSYAVNTDDLYEALKNKTICGAAIDVFDVEPLPADCKLLELDNITLTNHRGGDTKNSYVDSPKMMINRII